MKRKLWLLLALAAILCCGAALADGGVKCGDNIYWTLDETGAMTITGSGPMWDYNWFDNPSPVDYDTSVTSVVIGDGITHVGACFFNECSSIVSVSLPAGLESIGQMAFYDNTVLENIEIPSGISEIGDMAFFGCKALENITLPASVTSLGTGVFMDCYGLTGATLLCDVSNIGIGAFRNCKKLADVALPGTLTCIDDNAFQNCPLLTDISIPDGVQSVCYAAFKQCASLTDVTIPDGATSIGESAFNACTNLSTAVIPASVTVIDPDAFASCPDLTIYGYIGTRAQSYASENNIPFSPLYNWCGENAYWVLVDGTLTISGTGPMYNYDNGANKSPFNGNEAIQRVVIEDGVTSVGNYAFYGCAGIESIDLGSVGSLGMYACCGCSTLASVDIPESVGVVGAAAFERCGALASATVRNDNATLYDAVFFGCGQLTMYGHVNSRPEAYAAQNRIAFIPLDFEPEIFLPADLTLLETGAFSDISAIAVVVTNPGTSIVNGAFDDSAVKYLYGFVGTEAHSFAVNNGLFFVPIDETWLENHR